MKTDSPDDTLRNGALEGLGSLGDDRAVPVLLEWSASGKDFETRGAAIDAVAGLDLKNKTDHPDADFVSQRTLYRREIPDAIRAGHDAAIPTPLRLWKIWSSLAI